MSYTSMLQVPAKGEREAVHEYRNSHLSAFLVWQHLFDKHVKKGEHDYMFSDSCQRVWNLANPKSPLVAYERDALELTFDKMVLKIQDIPRAIEAFKLIDADIKSMNTDIMPTHFPEICDHLLAIHVAADPKVAGVCFIWTSVADDVWDSPSRMSEEEPNCRARYDISRDEGHWFAFSEEAPKEERVG